MEHIIRDGRQKKQGNLFDVPLFKKKLRGLFFGEKWYEFCLFHSRHLAKRWEAEPSALCWADKLSIYFEPWVVVSDTGQAIGRDPGSTGRLRMIPVSARPMLRTGHGLKRSSAT